MFKNLLNIFSKWQYLLFASIVFWIVLSISIFFTNRSIMWIILSSDTFSFLNKLNYIFNMYGMMTTNFTLFSATYTILIALLFSINISMLLYYILRQRRIFKDVKGGVGVGLGGLVSGFLGIGCASCGTFVFTAILSLFGISWILVYLPLKGQELGLLAIGLLIYSIRIINKKINAPMVCQ